jgi:uncharacterized protein YkwD
MVAGRRTWRRTAAANAGRLGALALALVLSIGVAPAAVEASDAPQERQRQAAAALSRYETVLLDAVNTVRRRHRREPLAPSRELTAAAELHTATMLARGFFDHEAPGAQSFWRRIARFYRPTGYEYWAVGENLAYGSPDLQPLEAVHEWLASPSHRRNLLWSRWRQIGLAAVRVQAAPGEFGGHPVRVVTADFGVRTG